MKEVNVSVPDDDGPEKELAITVQEDVAKPGNVLQFRVVFGTPITGGLVAHKVRYAITRGWQPQNRGPAFQLAGV